MKTLMKEIAKLNEIKRGLSRLENEQMSVHTCKEYDFIGEKIYNSLFELKHAAEDLLNTIDVQIRCY